MIGPEAGQHDSSLAFVKALLARPLRTLRRDHAADIVAAVRKH